VKDAIFSKLKALKTISQSLGGMMNKISLWFELLAAIIAVTIHKLAQARQPRSARSRR